MLDLDGALGGDLAFFPAHDRGFVDAEKLAKFLEAEALFGAESFDSGFVLCVRHDASVAYNATDGKPDVAWNTIDGGLNPCQLLRMAQLVHIHQGKTPVRYHYIPEWAERRQRRQADFAVDLGVDKGTVSRWFKGTIPMPKYLKKVIAYLQLEDDPTALFRHPDDDWMARLLKGRAEAEKERMRAVLEAAFPKAMGE